MEYKFTLCAFWQSAHNINKISDESFYLLFFIKHSEVIFRGEVGKTVSPVVGL
jgi:hypothetical protein